MPRVFWLTLCLLLVPAVVFAGSVRGTVTDEDGGPVFGARVQAVGKGRSANTDEQGQYRLDNLPAGAVTLRVSAEGYETQNQKVQIPAEGEIVADVKLPFSVTYDGADLVITDRAPVDESPQTSAHSFSREEIASNAGALQDITKAIQQLPGIVSGADFTSDMYVRGSASYENLIVLDHILLANPYHFGVGMSIIDTDLVKNFTFYAAGFPAQYPFATGSVLDITYKDGNRDHIDGMIEASLLAAKAQVTGPLDRQITWIVGARRSYYDLVINAMQWEDLPIPYFSDVILRATYEPNDKHRFVLLGLRSEDGAKTEIEENASAFDEGSAHYSQITQVYGLDYTFLPTSWALARTNLSYQILNASGNLTSGADSFFGRAQINGLYVNQEAQFDIPRNVFKFGGVYGRVDLNLEAKFPISQYVPGAQTSTEEQFYTITFSDSKPKELWGFYVQHEAEIVPRRLRSNIGVRGDYYIATGQGWLISPRVALSTNLADDTVVKTAWGIYYLPPYNSFIASEDLGNPEVRAQKSTHYVLGLEQGLGSEMMMRVESYYKEFDDLVFMDLASGAPSFADAAGFVLEDQIPEITFTNSGSGRAVGLEVFFQKKRSKWWDGWLAYTLGEVRYDDGMGLHGWYYPEHDQRHTLALVANFRPWRTLVASAAFRFSTGRPNTPVEGWTETYPETFLRQWQATEGPINSDRFPPYHRLDLRVEYTWGVHPKVDLTGFFEIYNVYNQQNLLGYYYEGEEGLDEPTRQPIYQLPFLPFLGLKATFR